MSLDSAIKKAIGVKVDVDVEKQLVSGDLGDFIPKEYADEFINLVREKNWCIKNFRTR